MSTLIEIEGRGTTATAEHAPARARRDDAIDWLRGVVMVLMVLDHARDFFHGVRVRATDLSATTPALFATRWITHFCAPVFVFLAGTAAYLYASRRSARERTKYLVTRGLSLVVLELTVVRLGWVPDPGYHFTLLQVIWAIGWCMVALAALAYLPLRVIAAIGAVLIVGYPLLELLHWKSWLAILLYGRGEITPLPGHKLMVTYAVLPWLGVMALGYALGPVVRLPERRRVYLYLGLAFTVAFLIVRGLNGFGDPKPWTTQRSLLWTLMSFLNCEKYPPSLAYLLMTLGPALMLLSVAPRTVSSSWDAPLVVLGRAPLFFYVAHLFLLRYTAALLAYARLGTRAFQFPPQGTAGSPELPLISAYIAATLTLVVLYPLCRWFNRYRGQTSRARGASARSL